MRTALVTGATSGIGRATVERLLRDGWHVLAAGRRAGPLAPLVEAGARPVVFDVTDPAGTRVAVTEAVEASGGRLHALVNAAGYGLYGAVEATDLDRARDQFEVNVLGLVAVTQTALPSLRRAGGGVVVNISSVAGRMTTPMAGWYSASKYAVEALSDALRAELHDDGIRVVVVGPAAIATGFETVALAHARRNSSPRYARMADDLERLVRDGFRGAPPPDVVAEVVARAVSSPRPRTRYLVPRRARALVAARGLLGDRAFDAVVRHRMRSGRPRTRSGAVA
ncbi:SDR family NAD(P)-dependent oxidoreductase [Geodermatophilus sp. SYSU D00710]